MHTKEKGSLIGFYAKNIMSISQAAYFTILFTDCEVSIELFSAKALCLYARQEIKIFVS